MRFPDCDDCVVYPDRVAAFMFCGFLPELLTGSIGEPPPEHAARSATPTVPVTALAALARNSDRESCIFCKYAPILIKKIDNDTGTFSIPLRTRTWRGFFLDAWHPLRPSRSCEGPDSDSPIAESPALLAVASAARAALTGCGRRGSGSRR